MFVGCTASSELYKITVFKTNEDLEAADNDDNPKNRLRYLEVYTSDEEEPHTNPQSGSSNILSGFELTALNIHPDTYVLVKIKS